MTENDFRFTAITPLPAMGAVTWQSPSNIALVKYWGKYGNQMPANPSLSFTLSHCHTKTTLRYSKSETVGKEIEFDILLDGVAVPDFKPKVAQFFERILPYCPYIGQYSYTIETSNSFPHSSGIASSASGMSALALCVLSIEREMRPEMTDDYFYDKASFLARLGSGSACRSILGPLVVWGQHTDIPNSDQLLGSVYPFEVHEVFTNFQDTILLVDKGEKQVSSTVGHGLMNGHAFAKARFEQAPKNISALADILKSGDLDGFIALVESEALTLHAMMMSSHPYFILMKPNTLEIINAIWAFRKETGIKLCFTLDAGANVHLLYPKNVAGQVLTFVSDTLAAFCKNGEYINDEVGLGAKQLA